MLTVLPTKSCSLTRKISVLVDGLRSFTRLENFGNSSASKVHAFSVWQKFSEIQSDTILSFEELRT